MKNNVYYAKFERSFPFIVLSDTCKKTKPFSQNQVL